MRHLGKSYQPELTGVRAFAAMLVLTLHAGQNFPNGVVDDPLVRHGYLGVDLFFILSGFIIAYVYMRALVPVHARSLCVFFWHRFVRLFPAHATVLVLLVGLIAVLRFKGIELNEQKSWDYGDLPWHFLMMHAWGMTDVAGWNAPSWSISAEWFAYLLFPAVAAIVLVLPRYTALPLAVAVLMVTAALFFFLHWEIEWAWLGPPALLRVASEFVCGVLIYRTTRIDFSHPSPWLFDALAVGGLFVFVCGAFLDANDFVLIALLGAIVAGVSGQGAAARAIFGCRPAVWLGEISYSTYVVHFPILLVLRHSVDHFARFYVADSEVARLMLFFVSLATVICAASLLYYLVEYPARHRLRNVFGVIGAHPSKFASAASGVDGDEMARKSRASEPTPL
jgi:peptidoglycan/LPS O-acetylase OafA/YrhL